MVSGFWMNHQVGFGNRCQVAPVSEMRAKWVWLNPVTGHGTK